MGYEFKYFHFGPLLTCSKIDGTLYQEICADITNTVVQEKIDFRRRLAGAINQEYRFNDDLQAKYQELIRPYIIEYVSNLVTTWLESEETHADNVIATCSNLKLLEIWVNLQKKHEYNPSHTHTGDISFVLYIDVPEEIYREETIRNSFSNGTIHFDDAFPQRANYLKDTEAEILLRKALLPIRNTSGLTPVNGDLFIFPSYLHHTVEAFESDVTRITVSGNFYLDSD